MKVMRCILFAVLIFSLSLQIVLAFPAKHVQPIPNRLYYPAVHKLLELPERFIYNLVIEGILGEWNFSAKLVLDKAKIIKYI